MSNFKDKLTEFWREWRGLVIFLVVMLLFRSAIADWNQVPTGSMKPTILIGDRVVVNKLAYDLKIPFTDWLLATWDTPKPGDIITFYSPKDEKLLIKRVIGLPGDIVAMLDNQLLINNKPSNYKALDQSIVNLIDEPERREHRFYYEQLGGSEHPVMLSPTPPGHYNNFGPVKVPGGHYLVLGDNRDHSGDFRVIGFIESGRITGRAHTVAFSVDHDDYYLPRLGRFFHELR